MPRWLKRGMDAGAIKAADAKVRETVEDILARDRGTQGRGGARDLSKKFDNWSPQDFQAVAAGDRSAPSRRSPSATSTTSSSRRRRCATSRRSRRETMHDLEVETLPGVVLGHRHIPVNSIGCYVPGGRYPMVASAHMSIVTAKVAGVKRIIACAPPFKGGPHPAIVAAMHFGGADEIYVLGGVQAVAAMALGTETISAGRHDRRPGQRLCGGGQAPAVRPRRHRPARRPDRDADHRRRQRRRRDLRHRPARPGRARPDLARRADHQFREARARHHG